MEMPEIKLAEISFRGAPTESQIGNALHDIQVFLNKAVGAMLLEGLATAESPKVVATFNSIAHLTGAEKTWAGESGLALPGRQQPQR